MSQHLAGATSTDGNNTGPSTDRAYRDGYIRRISTETKASFKTTELLAYLAAVLGVLIASAVADNGNFGAYEAWRLVTYLTIGYMVARGLAKAGSRDYYDDRVKGL
jgi:hypothetical protein